MPPTHSARRNAVLSTLAIGGLALFVLVGTRGVVGMFQKYGDAKFHRDGAEKQLAFLEERKNFLLEETKNLSTPEGIETELRKKFNVKREGEEVVILLEEAPTTSDEADKGAFSGFLEKIRGLFR